MERTLLIVDLFNVAFTAGTWFPTRERDGAAGFHGRTVLAVIARLAAAVGADDLLVAGDHGGPLERARAFPGYKHTRREQSARRARERHATSHHRSAAPDVPAARSYPGQTFRALARPLISAGIPVVSSAGHEADDLIASAVHALRERYARIVIVSEDHDLSACLVDDGIELVCLARDGSQRLRRLDRAAFIAQHQLRPEQLADLNVLVGSAELGWHGGLSLKEARGLLARHADAAGVLAHLDDIYWEPKRAWLAERADQILRLRGVFALRSDLPVALDAVTRVRDIDFSTAAQLPPPVTFAAPAEPAAWRPTMAECRAISAQLAAQPWLVERFAPEEWKAVSAALADTDLGPLAPDTLRHLAALTGRQCRATGRHSGRCPSECRARRSILARDRWICQDCGDPIDARLDATQPDGPVVGRTADGVLSGSHCQRVRRLAHNRCANQAAGAMELPERAVDGGAAWSANLGLQVDVGGLGEGVAALPAAERALVTAYLGLAGKPRSISELMADHGLRRHDVVTAIFRARTRLRRGLAHDAEA